MGKALPFLWLWVFLVPMATTPAIARTFYFPHYGDGPGVRMVFTVTNSAVKAASGTLTVYDGLGLQRSLPFETGSFASIDFRLPPRGTLNLKTLGTSEPFASGYVKVEVDQDEVSGVAIFKFATGVEASVLPSVAGRRFSLFAERSPDLDTGIAFLRHTSNPIGLELYDTDGNLLRSESFHFVGSQTALPFSQVFSNLPENFIGSLIMDSAGDFVPLGLRFGPNVLSTLPVTNLDIPEGLPPVGGPPNQSLVVLEETIFVREDPFFGFAEVSGAVTNTNLQDAIFVEVAIAAFDSTGKMVGGGRAFVAGTNRDIGFGLLSPVLLPGETGYFKGFFQVSGKVARTEFLALATEGPTSPPQAHLSVTSHSVTKGSSGSAVVSGTVTNTGAAPAEFITLDIILLDNQGRVLDVHPGFLFDVILAPDQMLAFTESTTIPAGQVHTVKILVSWLERPTFDLPFSDEM